MRENDPLRREGKVLLVLQVLLLLLTLNYFTSGILALIK